MLSLLQGRKGEVGGGARHEGFAVFVAAAEGSHLVS